MKKYMLFVICFLFVIGNAYAINPYSVIGNAEADWEQYGRDAFSGSSATTCDYFFVPTVDRLDNVTFTLRMDSGASIVNYSTHVSYSSGYSYFKIYVDGDYIGDTITGSSGCKTGFFDTNISDTLNHTITFECICAVGNDCGFNRIYYNGYEIENPNYYYSNYNFDVVGFTNYASPSFADLDNDGDVDMMVTYWDNALHYSDALENIGSITEPVWYSNSDWDIPYIDCDGSSPFNTAGDFADLDNDGDMDFCYSCGSNSGGLYCWENNGTVYSPSWYRKSIWDINTITGSEHTMTFGDINGDGLTDVFINDRHSSVDKYMYVNTGNITSPSWTLNNSIYIPASVSTSNFVDLNNDGLLDFYAGISYYENNGTSTNPDWDYDSSYNLPLALTGVHSNIRFFDFFRETVYDVTDPDFMVGSQAGNILPYISNLEFHPEFPCTPDITCSAWSSCFIEEDERIKQRMCYDLNNCSSGYTETTACDTTVVDEGVGFYSPTEPDSFIMIPKIIIPATDNNAPSINSQHITSFACFSNWYGYNDSNFDRMVYQINDISVTVYPNETYEPCGKGLTCSKPYGYIQSWDYLNNYFTQYDNYNTNLTVTCYDSEGANTFLSLTLNSKEEDYCYTEDDTVTKECFSFSDNLNNHIYSSTDLNIKPSFAFDLDRILSTENTPDWQMYRVTTDIINYFSSDSYENDAKDNFNKIAQKEGYQIIELFTNPQAEAQVSIDVYISDIYPKYFLLTDSDGQVQILIMFYNNEVYYYDGYSYKSLGDYSINTPYTLDIDFDVDNQRFKLGLNTWYVYLDDSYNVFSWKKIGSWQYNSKIGTFVPRFDDSKNIKYLAMTMMSEYCNTDSDCSSVYGSQKYYGATTTIYPAFSDDWGFKQIKEHLHDTDGSYLRYFDDEQSDNNGTVTINSWDDLLSGVFNNESIISIIWKSESDGVFCFGEINKTVNISVREGESSWTLLDTLSITPATAPQSYSVESTISFDEVKFEFEITGGTCFGSSRGSIDLDSVRATNTTVSSGGECRDIDWFAETFTNTSGNLEWAFNKSMNNSDFMLEWDDAVYDNLKLDTDTWNAGYCYSEMIIDNIETFTTKSTFYSSDEDYKNQIYTYEWIERLGWNLDGNQRAISGDSGAYVSNYYNWDVCTDEGREYNEGAWCIINVQIQVLWDILTSSIYGNFATFLMFLLLLMALSTVVIMWK
ncbi:hypothetical protein GQ473_07145 [archaeon]|nr:hypothetical protein [archaeon]